jgi:hypothetical protein
MNNVNHDDLDEMVRETHFMVMEIIEDSNDDCDDDCDDDKLTMPTPFHDFLVSNGKGPKLDESTVMDASTLMTYSRQSFREMLSSVSLRDLRDVPIPGLTNVKIYDTYIHDHKLFDSDSSLVFDGVDPRNYLIYSRGQRRMIQLAAQEAVDAELESWIHASQARKARLFSFFTLHC